MATATGGKAWRIPSQKVKAGFILSPVFELTKYFSQKLNDHIDKATSAITTGVTVSFQAQAKGDPGAIPDSPHTFLYVRPNEKGQFTGNWVSA